MSDISNSEIFYHARANALKYIGFRSCSSGKVRKYLVDKGYDAFLADAVVEELTERNFIDDYKACKQILISRCGKKQESKKYSYNRLVAAGVEPEIAEDYISHLDSDLITCKNLYSAILTSNEFNSQIVDITPEDYRLLLIKYAVKRGYTTEIAVRASEDFGC